ncbi:MAG TPA: hypothetical protein VL527_14245 [Dongiaceae bacterium]|jgi:hypothetical protein|nr:hypothetical protein [Dongiaceae bacterium]
MIRTLIIMLLLVSGLRCLAEPEQHFLRAPGSFTLRDGTNEVTVTASQKSNQTNSVTISWPGYDATVTDLPPGKHTCSDTIPLKADGWFVCAASATQVWVFDGVGLRKLTFIGKNQTDEYIPAAAVDKVCPKQVREALPQSYRRQ